MKPFTLSLLLLFAAIYTYAQKLPVNTKQDALWTQQYIARQNKKEATKTNTAERVKWLSGKVIYTPDSCVRFCQVMGRTATGNVPVYAVTAQGIYQGKVANLATPTDPQYYSFSDYPIATIVRLYSGKQTSYLMLSASYAWPLSVALVSRNVSAPLKKSWLNPNRFYHAATLLRLSNKTLTDVEFERNIDMPTDVAEQITSGNSLYASPVYTFKGKKLASYIKYDVRENEISFSVNDTKLDDSDRTTNADGEDALYTTRYTGYFKYNKNGFIADNYDLDYYPMLESLTKVIASKKFKTGRYITKVVVTKHYEQVGTGVLATLHTAYDVSGKKFETVDHMINTDGTNLNLKPNFKALDENNVVFLITDSTTPNHLGMCGACDYENSTFMLVTPTGMRPLFYFSWDSNTQYTGYSFADKKDDTDHIFYLEDEESTRHNYGTIQMAESYWKDKSTYVFKVSDDTHYRNFYLKFINHKSKISVKVIPGELMDEDKKPDADM